jgi:hypothetical protein
MKLKNKLLAMFAMVAALVSTTAIMSFAEGETTTLASALESNVAEVYTAGVNGISDYIFQVIGIAFPVAIGIIAVVIAIKFGIKFVRGLIGR